MSGLKKSSLPILDSVLWEHRIESHLKRHGEGLSFINCYVAEACVVKIPLLEKTKANIADAACILSSLCASGSVTRWEVITIPPTYE